VVIGVVSLEKFWGAPQSAWFHRIMQSVDHGIAMTLAGFTGPNGSRHLDRLNFSAHGDDVTESG
jgi:hypothetical protein